MTRVRCQRLLAYVTALLQLNLGWSSAFDRPVLDVVLERLPNTLLLMGLSTALAFGLGSLLGIVAGARPGSLRDRALSIGSIAIYAVPGFWLGLVLIVVFAVDLRWLPVGGIETIASGKAGISRALDIGEHLVLPVASLGLVYLALYLRLMRDGMVGRLGAGFRARRNRPRHFRAPSGPPPYRPQRAPAGHHHARTPVRLDARRQRRGRERLRHPRAGPAGVRSGRVGATCRFSSASCS